MPAEVHALHRTPLYDWHAAHGARLVDFAGWEMPIQYGGGIIEEHQAVRTAAGFFDVSHMGRLLFHGPGAADWLQHVFTNDVLTMKPGQVRYGLICNEQGGILDDVLVYRLPAWMMVVNASNREKIVRWLEGRRSGRDARLTDVTFETAMIAVQGPRAVELGGVQPPPGDLKYYFARAGEGRGLDVVSRTGYTGEDGYERILAADRAAEWLSRLYETGKERCPALRPCGLGARDTLRLEAGMPLYGHELTEEIDPFQAGLGWAVKMEKGDFVGRDALARRRQDPALRQRVGLELEGRRIAREGAAVLRDGKAVGRVTSGTFGPTLGKSVVMAYVEPDSASPGTTCAVDVRGKPAAARVAPLPFYRRHKPDR